MHVILLIKSLFIQAPAMVLTHVGLQVKGQLEETPVIVTMLVGKQVQVMELLYRLAREAALRKDLVNSLDMGHSLLETSVEPENMLVFMMLLMYQLKLEIIVV